MGDTLAHVSDEHLPASDRFVVTLRVYAQALEGAARFILLRGDDSRVFACFLEYDNNAVQEHDCRLPEPFPAGLSS